MKQKMRRKKKRGTEEIYKIINLDVDSINCDGQIFRTIARGYLPDKQMWIALSVKTMDKPFRKVVGSRISIKMYDDLCLTPRL